MVLVNCPSSVDPRFAKYFVLSELFYWFMPLNPYRRFVGPPVTNCWFYWGLFCYYFVLLSQLILMALYALCFMKDEDFIIAAAAIVGFLLFFNGIYATYFSWTSAKELQDLIHLLYEIFPRMEQERRQVGAEEWIQEWTAKMKAETIGCWVAILTLLMPLFVSVIGFLRDGILVKYLPLRLWLPFDALQMPFYPLVYVAEVWFFMANVLVLVAVQALLGALTMLVSLQFKCVAQRFRSIHFGDYQKDQQRMREAIHYHNIVLDISSKVRDLFSVSIIFNFVLSSMIVCVFMFLVINEEDVSKRLKYFCSLIYFWLYCCYFGYYGDTMIEHSSSVADAVYETNWLAADVRIQKMIVLVIQRAQSPQILTGLDFFVSSFPTLTKVLTTSYSYFTVLKTTYNGDNSV